MKKKIEQESLPKRVPAMSKPKAILKADLIVKLKELQGRFDVLKNENDKNVDSLEQEKEAHEATRIKNKEAIKQLQEKLEVLEAGKEINQKSSQAGVDNDLKCEECDFVAGNKTELSRHLNEDHGWPLDRDPDDLNMTNGTRFCSKCDYEAENGYDMYGHKWGEHNDQDLESLRCNYCDLTFSSLRELMYHKKEKHACTWKDYEIGDEHFQSENAEVVTQFPCHLCPKWCKSENEFALHTKQHIEKCRFCRK